MIFGEECKLQSSSLHTFLQPPTSYSKFSPYIFLCTLYSNTLNLCSSLLCNAVNYFLPSSSSSLEKALPNMVMHFGGNYNFSGIHLIVVHFWPSITTWCQHYSNWCHFLFFHSVCTKCFITSSFKDMELFSVVYVTVTGFKCYMQSKSSWQTCFSHLEVYIQLRLVKSFVISNRYCTQVFDFLSPISYCVHSLYIPLSSFDFVQSKIWVILD
jgi:hypothetical protein